MQEKEINTMKRMMRSEIEKLAIVYPYSTDYIEILLIGHDYSQETVHEILLQSQERVIVEVRKCLDEMRKKRQAAFERLLQNN